MYYWQPYECPCPCISYSVLTILEPPVEIAESAADRGMLCAAFPCACSSILTLQESELVALQLQQEEQEEAMRRGALTAESLARKELEDRERLKREKNDRVRDID